MSQTPRVGAHSCVVVDRSAEPAWRPTLPSSEVGMADLGVFAGATAEPSR